MKAIPDTAAGTTRGQLETSSWFAVVKTYLECSRRYTEMLSYFDLTVTQYEVLAAIENLGDEAQPKTIAHRLLVTRANITGVTKRLQERGLVDTVEHNSDGRSFVCVPTRAGRQLLKKTHAAVHRFVSAQLAPFSTEDLAQTRELMQAMHRHLETLDPAALARPAPLSRTPKVRSRAARTRAARTRAARSRTAQ